jgi:hypothetical protein
MDIIPAQKINIVMDISQFDTFRMCERKYFYRYKLNLHPLQKAAPLERGTLVHLAAELYYDAIRNGVQYANATVRALSAVRSAGIDSDLDVDDILRVIDVMEEYFDHWRVADQSFQIVDVEKPILYLLHEDDNWRLYLSGKIDLIVSDNNYTNLPMDHKSYDRQHNTTRMSNQFKNYVNALNSNYLVVNKIGFQKTLKPHEKFLRVPLSFDHLYLEQWKRNVVAVAHHYVDCLAQEYWPMNETSCDKFNRKCEYLDVCDSSGEEAVQYKLATLYIKGEPWDVTKGLKKTSEQVEEVTDKIKKDEELPEIKDE